MGVEVVFAVSHRLAAGIVTIAEGKRDDLPLCSVGSDYGRSSKREQEILDNQSNMYAVHSLPAHNLGSGISIPRPVLRYEVSLLHEPSQPHL